MNTATKARIANILTAIVSILAVVQVSLLTNPPFSENAIATIGAILTYVVLAGTAWKQYLSPDVSNTGASVTIWIAVAVTLTGLIDLLPWVNIPTQTFQWVKWGISMLVMVINITSKQFFPSELQKEKMKDLKTK